MSKCGALLPAEIILSERAFALLCQYSLHATRLFRSKECPPWDRLKHHVVTLLVRFWLPKP